MPDERQDAIEAVAAEWVSRLSGEPLRPDERRALDGWLAEHPDHRAAFDYARATWAELGVLRAAPGSLARDFVPPRARKGGPPRRRRTGLLRGAGALAAGVVIAVGLGALWFGDPVTMMLADHRTDPAETRSFLLVDGSTVELGPASAMALQFTAGERRIALLSGIAYVAAVPVSGAEKRPFVVEVAEGSARALGTAFMVERLPDAARVTVVSHRVEVAPDATPGRADSVVLSPGQSVRYDEDGALGPVRQVALKTVTAWRRGRLIFDRVPLAAVVAALNRYRRGRIVIADPALADRRVSGLFDTRKLDAALETIALELGAQKMVVGPFMTVLF